jgi:hypothetical protein
VSMNTERTGFGLIESTIVFLFISAVVCGAVNVNVKDSPYNAAGNGTANDRAAIQQAIDYVSEQGGGTVTLPGGNVFLSGDLTLGSNVTLEISTGAVLKQSRSPDDYAHRPEFGIGHGSTLNWDVWCYYNYPLVYGPRDSRNIKVTGGGMIQMDWTDAGNSIQLAAIGLMRVSGFEVSNITIDGSASPHVWLHQSNHGLVEKVNTRNPVMSEYYSDGISIEGCQFVHVTACTVLTHDDGIYVWSDYNDPRHDPDGWWDADDPMPVVDIEIDHCRINPQGPFKAFAFFPWGDECSDKSKVEIRDIFVHDNYLAPTEGGGWSVCSQSWDVRGDRGHVPMSGVVMRDNDYGGVRIEFQDGPQFTNSQFDFPDWKSESGFLNPGFEMDGIPYWTLTKNGDSLSAGAGNNAVGQDGVWYGYIDKLDKGAARIFQGLHLERGDYFFSAKVQSGGVSARMAVRDADNSLIAGVDFNSPVWNELAINFTVPQAGLYRLGIENGPASGGWARIDEASFGTGWIGAPRYQRPETPDRAPHSSVLFGLQGQRAGRCQAIGPRAHSNAPPVRSGVYLVCRQGRPVSRTVFARGLTRSQARPD